MLDLALSSGVATAGARLRGELRGLTEDGEVALMRVEHCPAGRIAVSVCSAVVAAGGPAAFELPVPAGLPPTWVGDGCGLEFVVRARSPIHSRRRRAEADAAVEVRGGEQPVHETEHLFDRLIASYPGRHFHLELEAALLEGGGHLRGRVHVDEELSAGVMHVAAQCREGWRTDIRVHNLRHAPLWRDRVLWREDTTIELGSDRRWYGFAFEVPPGLPPAVEGHIISWRYEIDAHHPVRLRPDDRAALTPLRFAIA